MNSETTLPSSITDHDLRIWLRRDYGHRGGGTRLATALGVSIATGCAILRDDKSAALVKAAALYGYVQIGAGYYCCAGAQAPHPTHVGYRRADLVEHKSAILAALADDRNRSVAQAAKASGFRLQHRAQDTGRNTPRTEGRRVMDAFFIDFFSGTGDYYLIPASRRMEWQTFDTSHDETNEVFPVPEYATPITHVSHIEFTAPRDVFGPEQR